MTTTTTTITNQYPQLTADNITYAAAEYNTAKHLYETMGDLNDEGALEEEDVNTLLAGVSILLREATYHTKRATAFDLEENHTTELNKLTENINHLNHQIQ